jgi:EmrB/QacA subfamily drug resistance transporter
VVIERYGYKNVVAIVYMAALLMQIMDTTIINVALPTLADEFGVEATAMDWTVLSFTVALAVMTPTAGWFGDRFGLRSTFLACLGGFVIASMLCGASQSLDQLVVGRAIQGGFAGMMAPIGAAMLFSAFPLAERADASRKVITVIVIGPALGPIIGGLILEFTSWRWIFFVNVPVGIIAFGLAATQLRRDDVVDASTFDVRGFVLSASGLGLLVYGLSRGGELGWGSRQIFGSLLVSLALLVVFAVVELRQKKPLLSLRLLEGRLFATVTLLAIPVYAGFLALVYLLPLLLQKEAGFSPLRVGLSVASQPIGVLLMTQITGKVLYKRIGPRRLIAVGSLIAFASGVAASRFDANVSVAVVVIVMLVRGFAMGLVFVPIQSAVYAQIEQRSLAHATAIFSTTRQLAPAIGIAIGSSVLATGFARDIDSAANRVDSYQRAILVTAAIFLIGGALALFIRDNDAAATMEPATTAAD